MVLYIVVGGRRLIAQLNCHKSAEEFYCIEFSTYVPEIQQHYLIDGEEKFTIREAT